jgi:hypothetical protein
MQDRNRDGITASDSAPYTAAAHRAEAPNWTFGVVAGGWVSDRLVEAWDCWDRHCRAQCGLLLRRPSRGHFFGRAFAQMVLTALTIRCRRADSGIEDEVSRRRCHATWQPGSPTEAKPILADLTRRGAELGTKTPLLDLATIHLRVYSNRLRRQLDERRTPST